MATRPCKDCDRPMSPLAYSCPQCERETNYGWLNRVLREDLVLLIICLMLYQM